MKKQTYLHIPEPCHENWEVMTPVQQGRFCQSCSKKVIDFSKMTDRQILDTLSKAAGSTCGRFSATQLERPVVKDIPYSLKPYKFLLSAFIPAIIASGTGSCQEKLQGEVAPKEPQVNQSTLMGAPVVSFPSQKELTGRVISGDDQPVPGATVRIKGTQTSIATDINGNFSLPFPVEIKNITLQVSWVGYKTKEVGVLKGKSQQPDIKLTEDDLMVLGFTVATIIEDDEDDVNPKLPELKKETALKGQVVTKTGEPLPFATVAVKNSKRQTVADSSGNFSINMKRRKKAIDITASYAGFKDKVMSLDWEKEDLDNLHIVLETKQTLPDVAVSCSLTSLQGRVGGLSVVRTVTIIDTAKTFIQKAFDNAMFKAYPNPIIKGTTVNLSFKKAGKYAVQLFDNAGRLYSQKELKVDRERQNVLFDIPPTIGTGIYYLKAINTSSQKQFIDKVIIQ